MISEIFYSIQGEGRYAGLPAVFVLTDAGAPRPSWCGSVQGSFKPNSETSFAGLLAAARKFWCDYAVIAGAEPLADDNIVAVADGLKRFDHTVIIESSGSHFANVPCDLLSLTLRIQNPAHPPKKKSKHPAYDIDILRQLIAHYDYQLQFLVADRADIVEVKSVTQEIGADKNKVLLMPAAGKGRELNDQCHWALEAARVFGYRYAPRLATPTAPKPE